MGEIRREKKRDTCSTPLQLVKLPPLPVGTQGLEPRSSLVSLGEVPTIRGSHTGTKSSHAKKLPSTTLRAEHPSEP